MSPDENPSAQPDKPSADDPDSSPPLIHADELFAGSREVIIHHGSSQYVLRITSSGKLLLTK